ncbi:MAG: 50S ribosomal protein L35 [candidate division Zixibacteria bacterium]|nr:50S ribosomal protein L35 [candidate division Zixibacteria bacterium]
MPKMKTNRSAAKRFKRTKSGLFKRDKAYRGHLSSSKTTKRQRRLRRATYVSDADLANVQGMLPNG